MSLSALQMANAVASHLAPAAGALSGSLVDLDSGVTKSFLDTLTGPVSYWGLITVLDAAKALAHAELSADGGGENRGAIERARLGCRVRCQSLEMVVTQAGLVLELPGGP